MQMLKHQRGKEKSASQKGGICYNKTGPASGGPAGANRLAERDTVGMLALNQFRLKGCRVRAAVQFPQRVPPGVSPGNLSRSRGRDE